MYIINIIEIIKKVSRGRGGIVTVLHTGADEGPKRIQFFSYWMTIKFRENYREFREFYGHPVHEYMLRYISESRNSRLRYKCILVA